MQWKKRIAFESANGSNDVDQTLNGKSCTHTHTETENYWVR